MEFPAVPAGILGKDHEWIAGAIVAKNTAGQTGSAEPIASLRQGNIEVDGGVRSVRHAIFGADCSPLMAGVFAQVQFGAITRLVNEVVVTEARHRDSHITEYVNEKAILGVSRTGLNAEMDVIDTWHASSIAGFRGSVKLRDASSVTGTNEADEWTDQPLRLRLLHAELAKDLSHGFHQSRRARITVHVAHHLVHDIGEPDRRIDVAKSDRPASTGVSE